MGLAELDELLLGDLALVLAVDLVADDLDDDVFGSELLQLREPEVDFVEGLLDGYIVDENRTWSFVEYRPRLCSTWERSR